MFTFDPLSGQWVFLLMQGSFGMLRSREGWIGDRIVFEGAMTMLGLDREWRMTLTRVSGDEFGFLNEERLLDGGWGHVDAWHYRRTG